MPIYEYRCEGCGERFEERLTAADRSPACSACGSRSVSRLWSPFATAWKPGNVNWHRLGGSWGEKPAKSAF
jgi:putative FmdB family regulatory protein